MPIWNGVWGIEDASKKYFGVSASQLSLDQSAVLAGMLKGPEIYNPLYSVENATNRRNNGPPKYGGGWLY